MAKKVYSCDTPEYENIRVFEHNQDSKVKTFLHRRIPEGQVKVLSTLSDVYEGEIVMVSSKNSTGAVKVIIPGVARQDIEKYQYGYVDTKGKFCIPVADNSVFARGDRVFWDFDNKRATLNEKGANGNLYMGRCLSRRASKYIIVELNQSYYGEFEEYQNEPQAIRVSEEETQEKGN